MTAVFLILCNALRMKKKAGPLVFASLKVFGVIGGRLTSDTMIRRRLAAWPDIYKAG